MNTEATSTHTEPTPAASGHRSPHTFEVVEPNRDKVDGRGLPENIAKRVAAHKATSTGVSKDYPNRQLYANSSLADHEVAEAWANDPDRLFSDRAPNLAILHEKPEHRLAIYLKAQGLSDKEICDKMGYTQPWFSQLKRQPWFKLRLVQELRDAGKDAIAEAIKGAALDSVYTLIDLRDDAQAPKAVRKAAADSLLDRFLGKAVQKVETKEVTVPSTEQIRAVDDEIKQIDQQLQSEPTNAVNAPAVVEPTPNETAPQS